MSKSTNSDIWIHSKNPFKTVTNDSYAIMKKIAAFTMAALGVKIDDPFFAGLYNTMLPFYTTFTDDYTQWNSEKGGQISKTYTLVQLLDMLRGDKIEEWESAIKRVYGKKTAEYIALFPQLRGPFQKGTQMERMEAVKSLIAAIGTDAELAAVKLNIAAFYAQLEAAYETQKETISDTGNNSLAVETSRVQLADELFGVLGLLNHRYRKNPKLVGHFFDLKTIRRKAQNIFDQSVKANTIKLIVKRTFKVNNQAKLTNQRATELRFALLANAKEPITTYYSLPGNSSKIVYLKDIGNVATCRYLKVWNPSLGEEGAYMVEII